MQRKAAAAAVVVLLLCGPQLHSIRASSILSISLSPSTSTTLSVSDTHASTFHPTSTQMAATLPANSQTRSLSIAVIAGITIGAVGGIVEPSPRVTPTLITLSVSSSVPTLIALLLPNSTPSLSAPTSIELSPQITPTSITLPVSSPVLTLISSLLPSYTPSPSTPPYTTLSSTLYGHGHLPDNTQNGPLSSVIIVGISIGAVGSVAVLLLVQLSIVLLRKYRSRVGGKRLTDSIPFTVNSETYTAVHAQLNEIYCNEAYKTDATAISTEPHTAYGENAAYDGHVDNQDDYEEYAEPCFQTTATADPTEHIETHGNEDYQTDATAISMEPHTAYGENAAYDGRVDNQNDYEGYAEPCFHTTATANPTEHIETHSSGAYQTTATAITTQQNATYSGQVDYPYDDEWEENATYAGLVDDQNVYEEITANDAQVDNEDDYTEPRFQTTATDNPKEYIEIHGNVAYQTTAISNTTQSNATYGDQVDDEFDCKENAAYGSRVGNQDDYEEDYVVPDY